MSDDGLISPEPHLIPSISVLHTINPVYYIPRDISLTPELPFPLLLRISTSDRQKGSHSRLTHIPRAMEEHRGRCQIGPSRVVVVVVACSSIHPGERIFIIWSLLVWVWLEWVGDDDGPLGCHCRRLVSPSSEMPMSRELRTELVGGWLTPRRYCYCHACLTV